MAHGWELGGNHDERLAKYLSEHPELGYPPGWDPQADVEALGWQYVPYKRTLRLGKSVLVSHDFGRHGLNSVHQGLNELNSSIVFGHTHRAQILYRTTLDGHAQVGFNVGHMADVTCDYMLYRNAGVSKRVGMLGIGWLTFWGDAFKVDFFPCVKMKDKWVLLTKEGAIEDE